MPMRALKSNEWDELNDLLEASYKGAENDHRFVRLYQEKPFVENYQRLFEYDPAVDSGLDINEKKFVGHFGLWPQKMQMGHAVILNGGGRDVATHPIARGKGFGQIVLADVRDFMLKNEVDISILFTGARGFYSKKGWRAGMPRQSFKIPKDEITKIMNAKPQFTEFNLDDLEVVNPTDADFEILTGIYEKSNEGLYYAAHRDLDYWKRHYNARHKPFWDTFLVKKGENTLAYFYINLNYSLNGKITLGIKEARVVPALNKSGSLALTIIFQSLLKFIYEEALEEGAQIEEVDFKISQNHPIVRHLYLEGYKLQEINSMDGPMINIGNPYSLFRKLTPEFEARTEAGILPQGIFWIKFDTSGQYPGGLRISNQNGVTKVEITKSNEEIEQWRQTSPDGLLCYGIPALTLIFARILEQDMLDDLDDIDENNVEPDDLEIFGDGRAWIHGMFSEMTYDLYDLDHF
jgi:predicted acetyltransferase